MMSANETICWVDFGAVAALVACATEAKKVDGNARAAG